MVSYTCSSAAHSVTDSFVFKRLEQIVNVPEQKLVNCRQVGLLNGRGVDNGIRILNPLCETIVGNSCWLRLFPCKTR